MRYKLLGRSGLRVSEICLGTMNFGNDDWGIDPEASRDILDAFATAGGNFIDSAHIYSAGESERIVGNFIAADRDHFVVATKYGPSHGSDIIKSGNSRRTMMLSVEESLKRLGTDYIDLLYLHIWDFTTPVEEVMRGLEDLVRMGKVLYVASSDMPAWQVSRSNMLADLRGWTPFVAIQVEYSLAQRTAERDLLPMARELDLGMLAWGPLAGGSLVSKGGPRDRIRTRQSSEGTARIASVIAELAGETGLPASQIALAGLRQIEASGRLVPILGASSVEQLKDNLGFLSIRLTDEQVERLREASRIELGFPHDFLASASVRQLLTGGQSSLLLNHRHQA